MMDSSTARAPSEKMSFVIDAKKKGVSAAFPLDLAFPDKSSSPDPALLWPFFRRREPQGNGCSWKHLARAGQARQVIAYGIKAIRSEMGDNVPVARKQMDSHAASSTPRSPHNRAYVPVGMLVRR